MGSIVVARSNRKVSAPFAWLARPQDFRQGHAYESLVLLAQSAFNEFFAAHGTSRNGHTVTTLSIIYVSCQ
jgi:hypothetical protein